MNNSPIFPSDMISHMDKEQKKRIGKTNFFTFQRKENWRKTEGRVQRAEEICVLVLTFLNDLSHMENHINLLFIVSPYYVPIIYKGKKT